MFDDKTYDDLMGEMMNSFGAEVRTDEGSLAYNACAKIAEALEDAYGQMEQINDNMLPDTQDLEHLIGFAEERGIEYNYATAPVVKGEFKQEIEIGNRFYCKDYMYTVTELIDGFNYKMECDTEGAEANGNLGELTPVDFINDYLGGEITETLVNGEDDEDEEDFRERILDSFKSTAFGGNKADYRLLVNAFKGVGGCKPKRREADSPWINIYVISNEFNTLSSDIAQKIQEDIDPEESHGEGDGLAPICHSVKIISVEKEQININTEVIFDTGYSVDTSKTQIENAISDYLLALRKGWEGNELSDTIVRIAQIDSKIIGVEGVLDVKNTRLNETAENIMIDYTKIPVMGEVMINV